MRYKCQFPSCKYETDNRNMIHEHHITPKSENGPDIKWNTINVCPNCHHRIYVETSKNGIHSINTKDSIQIIKWMNNGTILEYKDFNGFINYSNKK